MRIIYGKALSNSWICLICLPPCLRLTLPGVRHGCRTHRQAFRTLAAHLSCPVAPLLAGIPQLGEDSFRRVVEWSPSASLPCSIWKKHCAKRPCGSTKSPPGQGDGADLPIKRIKIDRSFIVDLPESENQRAVVEVIVALSRAMHMSITVEGIEYAAQAVVLEKLGRQEGLG